MWYALHCPNGNEEAIMQTCRQQISSRALRDVFQFTFEKMKRYQGSWHLEKEKMFPDYIFLESEDDTLLVKELKQHKDELQFLPVGEKEENLLKELCGDNRHMAMSTGVIRQGITYVTQGPLKGKEQLISKIDRHKRLAFLKVPGEGKEMEMKAGLEIKEKT